MDFLLFKEKIRNNFRLDLNSYKENQLKRRLDALRVKLGVYMDDYSAFFNLLANDRKAYQEFLDTVTINVSEFLRDKPIFDFLGEKVLPDLLEKKNILKIWSAACSSGAEPYSISIILSELTPGRRHHIEGSDIDLNILRAAAEACYSPDQVKNLSGQRLEKYFRKVGNEYYLTDAIKNTVLFQQHDLLVDSFKQGYDLISCRNVSIYFTREAQDLLFKKFHTALSPGGIFFIGASEVILKYREMGFDKIATCFYRKRSGEVDMNGYK